MAMVTETRDVRDFDEVAVRGRGDVILEQGEVESVVVETDEVVLPHVRTEVEGGCLILGLEHWWDSLLHPFTPLRFRVSAMTLKRISISGSGSVQAETLRTEDLGLDISGSGEMTFPHLTARSVSLGISGSGKMTAAGEAESVSLRISGSGNLQAGELSAQAAEVHISGSGTVKVNATQTLDMHISGSGSVSYYGLPQRLPAYRRRGQRRAYGVATGGAFDEQFYLFSCRGAHPPDRRGVGAGRGRRGTPDATALQVAYEPFARDTTPTFVQEGTAVRFDGAAASRIHLPDGVGLVAVRAQGDLRVHGVSGDVDLGTVRGDLRLDALSGSMTVSEADGDVRADGAADLRLTGACHGDLRFEAGGALAVEGLSGNLRVSSAITVRLGRVHGDLWAEKVGDSFVLDRADGDARLDDIGGAVTLGALAGDLRASKLAGGLAAARVSGDVQLHGPFTSPEGYTVSADGDIQIHLPADADLRLSVRAGGRIRSDVPLTPAADGSPNFSGTVGRGAGRMDLAARGDVRVAQAGAQAAGTSWERRGRAGGDPFAELSGLGDRIRQQVTASLAAAGINMETGDINVGRSRGARAARGRRRPPNAQSHRRRPPPRRPPSRWRS